MGRGCRAAAARSAAAAAFALVSGHFALAHEGEVPFRSILDRVQPEIDGLEVRVLHSVQPVIEVRNRTGGVLDIPGVHGEPFLRIHADRVEVNEASPTHAASTGPFGPRPAPPGDGDAEARWRTVERDRWQWFDPRIRIDVREEQAVDPEAGSVHEWRIEAALDERAVTIEGHIERREVHGHLVTLLEEVPEIDGLEIRVLEGRIPAVFVRNETGEVLEVPGLEGEPFLRIGPDGVEGNQRSPSFYLAGTQRIRDVPPDADAAAPPEWVELSGRPLWAWLEYRARAPEDVEPVLLGEERRIILRWTTPMELGGGALEVAGAVEWVPAVAPTAERRPWIVVVVVVLVLAAGGVLVVLRRS